MSRDPHEWFGVLLEKRSARFMNEKKICSFYYGANFNMILNSLARIKLGFDIFLRTEPQQSRV